MDANRYFTISLHRPCTKELWPPELAKPRNRGQIFSNWELLAVATSLSVPTWQSPSVERVRQSQPRILASRRCVSLTVRTVECFCLFIFFALKTSNDCVQLPLSKLLKIIFGSFGLPFGLIMTLVTGGELFTGNTALVTAAYKEGKIEGKDLVKNWVSSYAGNFVGSMLLAYLAFKSGTLASGPASAAIATAKCSLPWDVAFVRGILCNWLVCMAVYMASGCASMAGKMTAVYFPISAFVALGLDHSVANMFIIPLGIMRGAEITYKQFLFKNLIPVTLGNIVGGALCVMAPFGSVFGNWGKKKSD